MAIIKSLNSSYGISAEYHKVSSISINYQKKKVIICVSSFVNKEIRKSNYDPIDSIDVEVPIEDYPLFLSSDIQVSAYQWLKENVMGFENAEDDLEIVGDKEMEEPKNDQ